MDVKGCNQTNERASRRVWTKEEEEALLSVMEEIVKKGGRADCGSFKVGTIKVMESSLANMLPNSGLRANPHIESKVKIWKKDYRMVYDMLNTSGFSWNSNRKCVEVDNNEAWYSYIEHHKQAKGWRNKFFPHYERLAYIFGRGNASGASTYTPKNLAADVVGVDDNCDNGIEILGSSSPISVNQTSSSQTKRPSSSQHLSQKKSKSEDLLALSMDNFTNMIKDSIEKSNEILDKLCQVFAEKKNNNQILASDLKKMELSISDRVRVMKKFMQKPEVAETFKVEQNGEEKMQFVSAILSGAFDD